MSTWVTCRNGFPVSALEEIDCDSAKEIESIGDRNTLGGYFHPTQSRDPNPTLPYIGDTYGHRHFMHALASGLSSSTSNECLSLIVSYFLFPQLRTPSVVYEKQYFPSKRVAPPAWHCCDCDFATLKLFVFSCAAKWTE